MKLLLIIILVSCFLIGICFNLEIEWSSKESLPNESDFVINNPCSGRNETHFARNNRGCAWYFVCNNINEAVREGRCSDGYYFDYREQMCNNRQNVNCDLNTRGPSECPQGAGGLQIISHPYSCSFYTGEL